MVPSTTRCAAVLAIASRDRAIAHQVSIVSKKGVPAFGPALGNSLLFESGPYFREWLLYVMSVVCVCVCVCVRVRVRVRVRVCVRVIITQVLASYRCLQHEACQWRARIAAPSMAVDVHQEDASRTGVCLFEGCHSVCMHLFDVCVCDQSSDMTRQLDDILKDFVNNESAKKKKPSESGSATGGCALCFVVSRLHLTICVRD
jgi:hypothetical protein